MKKLNDLSVMTRLLTGFCFVAFLAVVVGFVGMSNITMIVKADTNLYEQSAMSILYAGDISEKYQKMRVCLRDILRAKDRATVEKNQVLISDINKSINETFVLYELIIKKYTATDSEESRSYKELLVSYKDLFDIVMRIADIAIDGKSKEAEDLVLVPSTVAIVTRIDKAVASVVDLNKKNARLASEANQNTARTAMIFMLSVIAIAVIIALILGYALSANIRKTIAKGLSFAKKIAEGDFSGRIDLDQKDELGQLGKALNIAADNLEKIVADIIVGSQNLVQAIQEISSGNQNLSQRTSEQASSLEEVASTMEESSATITQNAENSKIANDLAASTTGMAENGGKVMSEAVVSINDINESSKKIEQIITVINEIAFQTNLLALNAAVEAARAGDMGRGFAVVAGEVRNLAQRSAGAAKEIGGLIQSTISKVENGTSLANKSGDALKEIIISVKKMGKYVAEIAAASEEQRQGSQQINIAITELDTMTQQNAGLVEETASASEEIANQAQDLLAMMDKFKIGDQMRGESFSVKHKEIHLKTLKGKERIPVMSQTPKKDFIHGVIKPSGSDTGNILSKDGFEQF